MVGKLSGKERRSLRRFEFGDIGRKSRIEAVQYKIHQKSKILTGHWNQHMRIVWQRMMVDTKIVSISSVQMHCPIWLINTSSMIKLRLSHSDNRALKEALGSSEQISMCKCLGWVLRKPALAGTSLLCLSPSNSTGKCGKRFYLLCRIKERWPITCSQRIFNCVLLSLDSWHSQREGNVV